MKIFLHNRQRKLLFDLALVQTLADAAVADCQRAAQSSDVPLVALEELEVSIVSDRAIARVHGEFFDDPSETDVITFEHGELLIGAGVITANAEQYGQSPSEECALCIIHGMLHLAGWDDLSRKDAAAMKRRQEQIFKAARSVLG